jgi:hypothetical protein
MTTVLGWLRQRVFDKYCFSISHGRCNSKVFLSSPFMGPDGNPFSGAGFPKVVLAAGTQQLFSNALIQQPQRRSARRAHALCQAQVPPVASLSLSNGAGITLTLSVQVGKDSEKELSFPEAKLPIIT